MVGVRVQVRLHSDEFRGVVIVITPVRLFRTTDPEPPLVAKIDAISVCAALNPKNIRRDCTPSHINCLDRVTLGRRFSLF